MPSLTRRPPSTGRDGIRHASTLHRSSSPKCCLSLHARGDASGAHSVGTFHRSPRVALPQACTVESGGRDSPPPFCPRAPELAQRMQLSPRSPLAPLPGADPHNVFRAPVCAARGRHRFPAPRTRPAIKLHPRIESRASSSQLSLTVLVYRLPEHRARPGSLSPLHLLQTSTSIASTRPAASPWPHSQRCTLTTTTATLQTYLVD